MPTLEEEAKLDIPAATPAGKIFKLSSLGLPMLRNPKSRGELYIRVDVDIPKKLSDEEKKLLKELAKLRGEKILLKKKAIFDRLKENL